MKRDTSVWLVSSSRPPSAENEKLLDLKVHAELDRRKTVWKQSSRGCCECEVGAGGEKKTEERRGVELTSGEITDTDGDLQTAE